MASTSVTLREGHQAVDLVIAAVDQATLAILPQATLRATVVTPAPQAQKAVTPLLTAAPKTQSLAPTLIIRRVKLTNRYVLTISRKTTITPLDTTLQCT